MKIWLALAGWVGAVLRFVPVEFDVLRFWNSVRFALALQAPAYLHCVCVGFGPGLRGGARGPFIRRWTLPALVAFRMFWIGFRGFQIGFGVGVQSYGIGLQCFGAVVRGSGAGFHGFGLGVHGFGDGFRGFGVGLRCWGLFEAFGVGFPKFTAKP